jgi:hypothetical protein
MRNEEGDRVMWVSQLEMLDDLWEAREERDRLRTELRLWQERAFLYAPHVVKQAWVAEADNG